MKRVSIWALVMIAACFIGVVAYDAIQGIRAFAELLPDEYTLSSEDSSLFKGHVLRWL